MAASASAMEAHAGSKRKLNMNDREHLKRLRNEVQAISTKYRDLVEELNTAERAECLAWFKSQLTDDEHDAVGSVDAVDSTDSVENLRREIRELDVRTGC